jgi:hypothetical protein
MSKLKQHILGRVEQYTYMVDLWVLARWFFVIDAVSILTPRLKARLVMITVIGIMFFIGIGHDQIAQDISRSADEQIHANTTAIAVMNSKLDDKERRLEVLEAKADIAIAQGQKLGMKQDQLDEKLSWLVRLVGLGICGLIASVFHEIWQRVIIKRENMRSSMGSRALD